MTQTDKPKSWFASTDWKQAVADIQEYENNYRKSRQMVDSLNPVAAYECNGRRVEYAADINVRLLEQLNKTLELLQTDRNNKLSMCSGLDTGPTLEQQVETKVLECIGIVCTLAVVCEPEKEIGQ